MVVQLLKQFPHAALRNSSTQQLRATCHSWLLSQALMTELKEMTLEASGDDLIYMILHNWWFVTCHLKHIMKDYESQNPAQCRMENQSYVNKTARCFHRQEASGNTCNSSMARKSCNAFPLPRGIGKLA